MTCWDAASSAEEEATSSALQVPQWQVQPVEAFVLCGGSLYVTQPGMALCMARRKGSPLCAHGSFNIQIITSSSYGPNIFSPFSALEKLSCFSNLAMNNQLYFVKGHKEPQPWKQGKEWQILSNAVALSAGLARIRLQLEFKHLLIVLQKHQNVCGTFGF